MADVRKYLPEQYLNILGKNLPGLYTAINSSLEETQQLVQACIDQLFFVTASGRYLVQSAEEQGFVMPANSGLGIRAYRAIVPVMVSAPKQVRITINDIVKAFYGADRFNPNIISTIPGPYSIFDGDNIIIETESGVADVAINVNQVANINNVTAQEIASILNASQSIFNAVVKTDQITGFSNVQIISKTNGTGSFIRVSGGTLQNILKFPNVLDTLAETGTTYSLTKESAFTDEIRFTWDGLGTNPNLYLVNKDDVLTISGLVDGSEEFSLLNGSYKIIDSGYDYFVIRNVFYDVLSSTLTQNLDNNLVFTSSLKITIYDNPEYALVSETENQTVTVTVPAVPPLVRRFLQGSAHIKGSVHNVLDFNRNSIQIEVDPSQVKPNQDNEVVLSSEYYKGSYRKEKLKAFLVDNSETSPIYSVLSDGGIALPFTVSTPLSSNAIYGEIGSSTYTIEFPFSHGLDFKWGFTLSGFTGSGNVLAADINKEHVVFDRISDESVSFTIKDSSGIPVVFEGVSIGPFDVYRHTSSQSDLSDFYLDFGTSVAALASGLSEDMTFTLDNSGTDINIFYSNLLKNRKLVVKSISGQFINFSAGLGVGPEGLIIDSVSGNRSGQFGGSGSYFFDKTSTYNVKYIMSTLKANFIEYNDPRNPDYLGPYVFDPTQEKTTITVSGNKAIVSQNILKGESLNSISLSDATDTFPDSGLFVINYGKNNQEGPVRFNSFVLSQTSIQILPDPAYKFQNSHSVGSEILVITDNKAMVPAIDGSDYPFYLTGTTAARNTLFQLVELLVASGIFVERDVILPDLRYIDPSLSPFE